MHRRCISCPAGTIHAVTQFMCKAQFMRRRRNSCREAIHVRSTIHDGSAVNSCRRQFMHQRSNSCGSAVNSRRRQFMCEAQFMRLRRQFTRREAQFIPLIRLTAPSPQGEGNYRGFSPFRVEKLREAVMRGCRAPEAHLVPNGISPAYPLIRLAYASAPSPQGEGSVGANGP